MAPKHRALYSHLVDIHVSPISCLFAELNMAIRRKIRIVLTIVMLLTLPVFLFYKLKTQETKVDKTSLISLQRSAPIITPSSFTHGNVSNKAARSRNQLRRALHAANNLDREDFYKRDLIEENNIVESLSPLLKTNLEVIEEAQRIQLSMFNKLIGRFKYAMLFNFAAFENKGDPAITVGELKIIRKIGIELMFHCETGRCLKSTLESAKNLSKRYDVNDVVVLMHGGGNLLSYEYEDEYRKKILGNFPDFEVILFPQSIWPNASRKHIEQFKNIYSAHKHLTFLYRDRNSYHLGMKLFPNVKAFLMPDMAFQIGAVNRFIAPTHDILWLKRTDTESTKYKVPTNTHGYDVIVSDWWYWKTPKGSPRLEDPVLIAANGMMFLQRGRVVITDRLHGHILSVLCGIPHVVIDPVNHKISSYMRSWTGGLDNVVITDNPDDALFKAIQLLHKLDGQIPKKLLDNSLENL